MTKDPAPDLILKNGRFTTLDRSNPNASAVAIKDGRFARVGSDDEVMASAGSVTRPSSTLVNCACSAEGALRTNPVTNANKGIARGNTRPARLDRRGIFTPPATCGAATLERADRRTISITLQSF